MKYIGAPPSKDKAAYDEWWRKNTAAGRRSALTSAKRIKEWKQRNPGRYRAGLKRWSAQNPDFMARWRNTPSGQAYTEKCEIKRERIKRTVMEFYGGSPPVCRCCGEDGYVFLGIDHKNGGGTKHRDEVGFGTKFYIWILANGFPPGFQVLCHNCNFAKGTDSQCLHQTGEIATSRKFKKCRS